MCVCVCVCVCVLRFGTLIHTHTHKHTHIHINTLTHTHTHTHTYIYIYIYCHPETDCFVVSQLFSVARRVGRLKLGSKPTQIQPTSVLRQLGNFKELNSNSSSSVCLFTFYTLPDTRVLNSFEEL